MSIPGSLKEEPHNPNPNIMGSFFFAIGIKVLEVSNPMLLGYLKNVLNVGKE